MNAQFDVATVPNFNVDMLRLAREIRMQTQADVARNADIGQALISKLENGLITSPSAEALTKIADALDFPTSFFVQTEKAQGFPHFHFRKRAKLGAKPLAHVNAVVNLRRMHIAKLMRSYDTDVPKPIPQLEFDVTGMSPEKVAERVREYWMLPRGPIDNLTKVIEDAGGIVVLCNFGTNLLDGISFRSPGLPPIFCMNREVPGDRFRFSLAHELGHMIMHAKPDDEAKQEAEAHRFAAAFLMPASDIRAHLSAPKISTLGRVKAFWKVSIKALIKRAHDLHLIADQQYKNLMVGYSKVFKEGESFPIEVEKAFRLRQIIDFHVEKLGYSVSDLAALFCLREVETQKAYLGPVKGNALRLVVSNC